MKENTKYVFNKGYNVYKTFDKFTDASTGFVTRIKDNAVYDIIEHCTIANLLMIGIQNMLKRKWAFSNLVSFCKIHLFNYIHLIRFLENPDKDWQEEEALHAQFSLF